MKIAILDRWTGTTRYEAEVPDDTPVSRRKLEALKVAIKSGADLSGSNLSGADLSGSNLSGADLSGSNLSGSNLSGADLSGADLSGSNLSGSNLSGADLSGADLSGSNLSGSNLSGADLSGSNLSWFDLSGADLSGADLSGADLSGADLSGADLSGSNLSWSDLSGADLSGSNLSGADLSGSHLSGADLSGSVNFPAISLLPEGTLVGWKKLKGGIIARLEIGEGVARVNSTRSRKCRAESVRVTALFDRAGAELGGDAVGISGHDRKTEYRVGATVVPDSYNPDFREECTNGIHFFITRSEAEAY